MKVAFVGASGSAGTTLMREHASRRHLVTTISTHHENAHDFDGVSRMIGPA